MSDSEAKPTHGWRPSSGWAALTPEGKRSWVAFAVLLVGFAAVVGLTQVGHQNWLYLSCWFMALLVIAFGRDVVRWIGNRLALRKLGSVFVSLPPEGAAGERLPLIVHATPPPGGDVIQVRATLLSKEVYTTESNKTRARTKEQLQIELRERSRTPRGAFTYEGTLALPRDSPPSGRLNGVNVSYLVEVTFDVPDWPDWIRSYPLEVTPYDPERAGPRARIVAQARQTTCPYCRDSLTDLPPDHLLQCGSCGTIFHAECIHELGRCTTRGCSRSQPRPRVRG